MTSSDAAVSPGPGQGPGFEPFCIWDPVFVWQRGVTTPLRGPEPVSGLGRCARLVVPAPRSTIPLSCVTRGVDLRPEGAAAGPEHCLGGREVGSPVPFHR